MKYIVEVSNKPAKSFFSADDAISHAASMVYLSPSRVPIMRDTLEQGSSVTFCYGWMTADITVVTTN
jgi:hypothetical protein